MRVPRRLRTGPFLTPLETLLATVGRLGMAAVGSSAWYLQRLEASRCWAGLVPYTADAQGSALLLCVSADGSEWDAFLGPHDGGEEAQLEAAVTALCAGTQGLLAPAGSRADEAEAHLLSKLQAGKGVHRLASSSGEGVLFLTPTRRRAHG